MTDLLRLTASPTEAEIDAWHAVVTDAHARDLPAAVPAPDRVETAGALRVPAVSSRYVRLAVPMPDGDGYAGVASLRLFDDEENRATAWIDRLVVRPDQRRRGIGARLWRELREVLAEEKRTSVSLEIELGGEGEQFAVAHGATCALPLVMYVQRITEETAEPPRLPDGYRFVHWNGVVPDEHAEPFAVAHGAMADSPMGDVDEKPFPWDADRIRAAQNAVVERGGVMLTVVAVAPDGTHAGYSELVQRAPGDVRALQYDTAVAPAYRRLGLGRAVKLRMLELLAEEGLPVREIATTVADDNGPMRAVNKLLGYRPERSIGIYQVRLPSA
ncbi:GNAT family N-acetyltransferase [Streptomyces syringium]|uniref:GNAT family N-acetyltransferase n=1 Tax=Streptomyces syringium TaxID=76729 RepID=UPI00365B601E